MPLCKNALTKPGTTHNATTSIKIAIMAFSRLFNLPSTPVNSQALKFSNACISGFKTTLNNTIVKIAVNRPTGIAIPMKLA